MSPSQTTPKLEGPAFSRIPPWVKAKLSPLAIEKIQAVFDWVENECIPREQVMKAQLEGKRWTTPPLIHELRERAKERGLFNLFLPNHFKESPGLTNLEYSERAKERGLFNLFLPNHFKESPGLTNLEYSCCAEIMGRCYWAAQTMNCHAPETGNIELLAKYCSPEQKAKWLQPLLDGTASSAYSMTEPDVASSDATQIGISIRRDGDQYVINGRKLYGNCLWNKELSFYILMGCTAPDHPDKWRRHSMLIVPCDTPGITQVRNLTIMGYDHAPEGHGEYKYDNVRVPVGNVILGEGRAFEIAQGRLGPGRARLVVLNAADTMDLLGNKAGKRAIAQSKILVPELAARIIDECMQIYGGQGLTQHTPLPEMWTYARFVRVADGPDAAHRHQVGREEMKTAQGFRDRHQTYLDRYKEFSEQYGEKFVSFE
ncbi:acyl-CoA dehydrogenase IBR3 like protein [Verticillium longisporum]|uniref:Acyl-CoA dehydrogenase IBR3 like protein n=1 Tax=Verticillium longisporum TaxID=100787 RepID=A0A8I3AJW0_VERLO|nr:acyl-CoA dehydrogenase IBR3 like protein [Verticillium longisporum]